MRTGQAIRGITLGIVLLLAVSALVYWLFWTALTSLFADACANGIRAPLGSPDSAYKAVMEIRDCGATTSFVTGVYVLPADEDFAPDEDRLALMSDHGEVKLRWIAPRQLEIDLGTSRIFHQAASVDDVTITYIGTPTWP